MIERLSTVLPVNGEASGEVLLFTICVVIFTIHMISGQTITSMCRKG